MPMHVHKSNSIPLLLYTLGVKTDPNLCCHSFEDADRLRFQQKVKTYCLLPRGVLYYYLTNSASINTKIFNYLDCIKNALEILECTLECRIYIRAFTKNTTHTKPLKTHYF